MLSPVKIGHHIRQLREARDYSQDYMAEMLNMSQSAYANIENGRVHIRVDRLFEIAHILDVPPLRLLDGSMTNNPLPSENQSLTNHGYDELIQELRSEIAFLRHIVELQERKK